MVKDLLSSRILVILLVIIASIYLLQFVWTLTLLFSDVILILFLSWLLSFILDPLVDRLSDHGISRLLSAAIVYLIIALIISGILFLFLPTIIAQLLDLSERLPFLAEQAPKFVTSLETLLKNKGIDVELSKTVEEGLKDLSTLGLTTADKLILFISSFFSTIFAIILVLVISFYLVIDGEKVEGKLIAFLPKNWQEEALFLAKTINSSFAGFLRGQLTVALIWGLAVWVVLSILGIVFAPIAALAGGVLMIIPVIGGFFGLVPPLLGVYLFNANLFWLVLLILLVVQLVEVNILAPIIFERAVGLHPVFILISFLVGLKLGGGWGALFAVPVGSIAWAIIKEVFEHIRTRRQLFK